MATDMGRRTDDAVRQHAEGACQALLAGDVDGLIRELSDELQRNPGEVVALLPLPLTAAEITGYEQNGKATLVTLALTGETDAVDLQTRWKDRDGEPRIVEVSHTPRTPALTPTVEERGEAAGDAGEVSPA